MDQSQNLFGTDWMEAFDLFNVPENTFWNNVNGSSTNTKNWKRNAKKISVKFFQRVLDFAQK